jgi:hypothetical protein
MPAIALMKYSLAVLQRQLEPKRNHDITLPHEIHSDRDERILILLLIQLIKMGFEVFIHSFAEFFAGPVFEDVNQVDVADLT